VNLFLPCCVAKSTLLWMCIVSWRDTGSKLCGFCCVCRIIEGVGVTLSDVTTCTVKKRKLLVRSRTPMKFREISHKAIPLLIGLGAFMRVVFLCTEILGLLLSVSREMCSMNIRQYSTLGNGNTRKQLT